MWTVERWINRYRLIRADLCYTLRGYDTLIHDLTWRTNRHALRYRSSECYVLELICRTIAIRIDDLYGWYIISHTIHIERIACCKLLTNRNPGNDRLIFG